MRRSHGSMQRRRRSYTISPPACQRTCRSTAKFYGRTLACNEGVGATSFPRRPASERAAILRNLKVVPASNAVIIYIIIIYRFIVLQYCNVNVFLLSHLFRDLKPAYSMQCYIYIIYIYISESTVVLSI